MTARDRLRAVAERGVPWFLAAWRALRRRVVSRIVSPQRAFTDIYRENAWGSAESRSGHGSSLQATAVLRPALGRLLAELEVRTLLDAGCGDFRWMREMPLDGIRYVGADVVADLIAANQRRFGSPDREFILLDVTSSPLPRADLVLCRHVLFHLPDRLVLSTLRAVCASGARWLLATTDPDVRENVDAVTGSFRPLNLESPPFGLPRPLRYVDAEETGRRPEGTAAPHGRDRLGLWRVDALVKDWPHAG